jgi:hypothetical protein
MAFKNIVEGTRKTNEKMIAMGQSLDIQKMPRPKGNSSYKSSPAMMAAGASDIELKLYPKNFKASSINQTEQLNNSTKEMIEEIKEQTQETEEVAQEKPKMIGDEDIISRPRSKQSVNDKHCNIIKNVVIESQSGVYSPATWKECRYMKEEGGRVFCREYLSWCGKEKCQRARR